ncbi:hypothetical protein ACSHWD_02925 [Aerococcus urinaeequi]|uniref:Integrase n=1 Tax=Aerococcus urinaeequi TaxID=51665 RepID=A0A7M1KY19_9LACT|nr:hypothetical protein [Aerococcus urinaeequi]MCI6736153.1 hypothetical protein [Aerococcus urinaeequi]QOQ79879.1 hypothetical protein IMX20_04180 [Aerococcus urinaeequi]
MFIEELTLDCRVRNLALRTIKLYEDSHGTFIERSKITKLEDLKMLHVKRMIVSMQEEDYNASFIYTILKAVKVFINYFVEEDYMDFETKN